MPLAYDHSGSLAYNHFGKTATFDKQQAEVVAAIVNDWLDLFSKNVRLEIDKEELEKKLKAKKCELEELQKLVDASISNLDPDRE